MLGLCILICCSFSAAELGQLLGLVLCFLSGEPSINAFTAFASSPEEFSAVAFESYKWGSEQALHTG